MNRSESGQIHITEQTGRLGNFIGGILNVTILLVALNGILGELRKWSEWIIFCRRSSCKYYNKKPKDGNLSTVRSYQKLNAWAAERGLTFSTSKKVNMIFGKRETWNQWRSH